MKATEEQVLCVIRAYIDKNGYSPTIREIGDEFGLSVAPIKRRLDALRERGAITFVDGKSRTVRVVDNGQG